MKEFDGMSVVRNVCEYAKKNGAEKAQVKLGREEKYELNVEAGKMSLYRTTVNTSLGITVLTANRKGSVNVNHYDEDSIKNAVNEALVLAKASESDSANDISPNRQLESFSSGPSEADSAVMYDQLKEYIDSGVIKHPDTKFEQCILDFTFDESFFSNTNGAEFTEKSGYYSFFAMFTTKIGAKSSSFNYSGAAHRNLAEKLWHWGNIEELVRQSTEQTDVKTVDSSFTGDVIITPDCLGTFIQFMNGVYLGDVALVTGNSPWKDMIGKVVASPLLSVHSAPNGPDVEVGYSFTADGFRAENCSLINKGVLENFTLGLYGSNKTGKPRCPSGGGAIYVHNGDTSLADMIADVKKGILLGRFSGGNPAENGDFSGVAKNSYYIENGKIVRPVGETMIAGNIASLFKELRAISREQIDFGYEKMPWILSGNVTVSGKN